MLPGANIVLPVKNNFQGISPSVKYATPAISAANKNEAARAAAAALVASFKKR
jgi:hypothetical protein